MAMIIIIIYIYYWTEKKVNITPWNLPLECILPASHKGEAAAQWFFLGSILWYNSQSGDNRDEYLAKSR
jgi:hypothetical protein